jgi:hypothetical protein
MLYREIIAVCAQNRTKRINTLCEHHATGDDTPIHDILSTAPQLSICKKALGTLPENGNVITKHVGATIHNY